MFVWVRDRGIDYSLTLTVLSLVALPHLGTPSLWDRDEGYYCTVSREMLSAGDWVRPSFNGQPFSEKPALLYWAQMASYLALGPSELAARVPSVLAAAAVLLLVYEFARHLFGRSTALLSAWILATCAEFCLQAHAATPDMPLLLFTVGSLACFWLGLEGHALRWHGAAGAFCGLALLTKGPVGLALPGLTVALYALWDRRLRLLAGPTLWLGIAVSLVVAAPWYLAVTLQTDNGFLPEFLGTHNVGRFVTPLENHGGSVFYQLLGILVFLSPWNLVLLAVVGSSLAIAGRRSFAAETATNGGERSQSPEDTDAGRSAYRFLLAWIATYLGFFSLAATQLPHYVFPLYPPLAILTARYLDRWRQREIEPGRAMEWIAWLSFGLVGAITALGLAAVGGAVTLPGVRIDVIPGMAIWSIAALGLPLSAAAALVAHRLSSRTGALAALSLGALAFTSLLVIGPAACVEPLKAPRGLAAAVRRAQPAEPVQVATLAYFQPSLVYYLKAHVTRLDRYAEAAKFLAQREPACVVLPAEKWRTLAAKVGKGCRIVDQRYDLYARQEIVAVVNFPPPAGDLRADRPAVGARR